MMDSLLYGTNVMTTRGLRCRRLSDIYQNLHPLNAHYTGLAHNPSRRCSDTIRPLRPNFKARQNFQENEMQITMQHSNQPVPAGIAISALPFLLAAVVFAALPQIAHADDGCEEFRGPPAHRHGGMPPPPGSMMGGDKPPMNMQRPAGPFAELGLSEAQQKKVDELMRTQSTLLCEAERRARLSMQELQQLSGSGKFDEKKAAAIAAAHGKAVTDIAYLHAETHARIWELLSGSQRKRLTEQMEQCKGARPCP